AICTVPCSPGLPALFVSPARHPPALHSFPTRRSSDLLAAEPDELGRRDGQRLLEKRILHRAAGALAERDREVGLAHAPPPSRSRSEEHTSELQSPDHLVCRLLLEKKKNKKQSSKPDTT